MEKFNKFILVGDTLIAGKVSYHRNLMPSYALRKDVKGGGWFDITPSPDPKGKPLMVFFGTSEDFGKATFEDIKQVIDKNNLMLWHGTNRDLYDEFEFAYRIENGAMTIIPKPKN